MIPTVPYPPKTALHGHARIRLYNILMLTWHCYKLHSAFLSVRRFYATPTSDHFGNFVPLPYSCFYVTCTLLVDLLLAALRIFLHRMIPYFLLS